MGLVKKALKYLVLVHISLIFIRTNEVSSASSATPPLSSAKMSRRLVAVEGMVYCKSCIDTLLEASPLQGENGVVIVKSEEEFTNAMSKAQGGSSPSIFYFTATWCGPCRSIAPIIEELSKQYPDVTTYKVDIDQGWIKDILSEWSVGAVPTLLFFKDGSKKAEIVGADVPKLKKLMEQLYK